MKTSKKYLFLTVTLLVLLNCGNTLSQSLLKTSGSNIFNSNGEKVYLKGFNLAAWLLWEGWMWNDWNNPPEHRYLDSLKKYIGEKETIIFWKKVHETYITEKDIEIIKNFGFNCVRLPINYNLLYKYNNGDWAIPYGFNFIDKVINWCEKNNIYIILDLHSVPGSQVFETFADSELDSNKLVWNNELNQQRTIKIWKKLSKRYKNRNIVAGYNLINEPFSKSNIILVNFYNKIISGIREEDNRHIIFLDGNGYAVNFDDFEKINDNNVVLCPHRYSDYEFFPKESLIQNYEISKKLNKPIWLGEWGENSTPIIDSIITLLKSSEYNYSGWSYWPWKRVHVDNKPVPVTFNTKENWNIIKSVLNDKLSKDFKREEIIEALNDFIETIKTENCSVDSSYIKLLAK